MSVPIFEALRRLSHEEFRSGERVAKDMGLSRSALWNALQSADQLGVQVFKVHGRGYRLASGIDWLDYDEVIAHLGEAAGAFSLHVVDRISSTNSTLVEQASAGAASGTCLAAEVQSAGRGRRGRNWHSPLGGGLTFSLLWRFTAGAAVLSTLSLAVGVAVVRALRGLGVTEAMLKWPNDIVHRHHKLGGILIELQGDVLGPTAAVIGIGLNIRMDETTRGQIPQPVTDLATVMASPPTRNEIWAAVLKQLANMLTRFETRGFAELRDEWERYHAYGGRAVRLHMPNGTMVEGQVTGVAEDGSLLLYASNREQRFTVGEISLRGHP